MAARRFPLQTALRDGRGVRVRPFVASDAEALHAFFQRLPGSVRRFAWDAIDKRPLIDQWAANIDYEKAYPLLAFDGSRIVADASLHRRAFGPLRLVGRIKWLIDPDYRGAGLGATLVNLLMDVARERGLRHLTCMLISDLEQDAIDVLTPLGFTEYKIPGYGADPDGDAHDMSKLVFSFDS